MSTKQSRRRKADDAAQSSIPEPLLHRRRRSSWTQTKKTKRRIPFLFLFPPPPGAAGAVRFSSFPRPPSILGIQTHSLYSTRVPLFPRKRTFLLYEVGLCVCHVCVCYISYTFVLAGRVCAALHCCALASSCAPIALPPHSPHSFQVAFTVKHLPRCLLCVRIYKVVPDTCIASVHTLCGSVFPSHWPVHLSC